MSPYIRQHSTAFASSSNCHEKGLLWLLKIDFGKEKQNLLKHWGEHWVLAQFCPVLKEMAVSARALGHRYHFSHMKILTFGQIQWVAARHHQKQIWEGRQKTLVVRTVSTRFARLGWELESAAALQTSSALGRQRRWEDLCYFLCLLPRFRLHRLW